VAGCGSPMPVQELEKGQYVPARQPSVQQLTYFLASVQHGSFAAAAQSLYIAQPSLSDQIRRLEAVLGVRLFTRTNRRLQLTDAGRMVVPWAQRVLADLDELTSAVRDIRELAGGTVAFGTFSSAHLYLLPALTAEFHVRHPDVQIRVQGLNSSEVAAAVRAGSLEAGLVQLPIDDQGLWVSAPVLTDTVVYVSADPARTTSPVTVEQLCRAPLILSEAHWAHDDPLRRTLTERAQRAGVALDPAFEVEFQTAAVEMAAEGVGDALCRTSSRSGGATPQVCTGPRSTRLSRSTSPSSPVVAALCPRRRARSWRWRSSTSEPYRTWLTPDAASPI